VPIAPLAFLKTVVIAVVYRDIVLKLGHLLGDEGLAVWLSFDAVLEVADEGLDRGLGGDRSTAEGLECVGGLF
jgi:hypothetical protein